MVSAGVGDSSFWKDSLKDLNFELPTNGISPPELEITSRTRKKTETAVVDRRVTVQKITSTIYVMTDTQNKQFSTKSKQNIELLGEMSLGAAMALANKGNLT